MKIEIVNIIDGAVEFQATNSAGKIYCLDVFDCETGNLGLTVSVGPGPIGADTPQLDIYVSPDLKMHSR